MVKTGMRSKGELLVGVVFKIIETLVQSPLGICGYLVPGYPSPFQNLWMLKSFM